LPSGVVPFGLLRHCAVIIAEAAGEREADGPAERPRCRHDERRGNASRTSQ